MCVRSGIGVYTCVCVCVWEGCLICMYVHACVRCALKCLCKQHLDALTCSRERLHAARAYFLCINGWLNNTHESCMNEHILDRCSYPENGHTVG